MREIAAQPIAACVALAFAATAGDALGATIIVDNADDRGVGFNDTTPAAAVGGNTETTRGAQALAAFRKAASFWEAALDSPVPIHVSAKFAPLACSQSTGTTGGAHPHAHYVSPRGDVEYAVALANRIAGEDLNGAEPEIDAQFNGDIGKTCLLGQGWYFGLDGMPIGMQTDFVSVVLHELAHGLGFSTRVDLATGKFIGGVPDSYSLHLFDERKHARLAEMDDAGRADSIRAYHQISFDGPEVTSLVPTLIDPKMPVLTLGNPLDQLSPAIAIASFGHQLDVLPVKGQLAAVDDGTGTTTDACEAPLASMSGKIAFVEAGQCDDEVKIKYVQAAHALAAILVSDSDSQEPLPFSMSPVTDVNIVAVRIDKTDADAIRAAIPQNLTASLMLDPNRGIGTSLAGRLYVDATDPPKAGVSLTHWDPMVSPPLLMDVVPPTTQGLDITVAAMHDIGWRPYRCGDGIVEGDEQCEPGVDAGADGGGPCTAQCRRPGASDGGNVGDAGLAEGGTGRSDASNPYKDAMVGMIPLSPEAPTGIVWAKKSDSGCGCRTAGEQPGGRSALLFGALAAAAALRRKRR